MIAEIKLHCMRTWAAATLFAGLAVGLAPAVAAAPVTFDVRSYGATGDGQHLDTAAINRAIDACSQAGGGKVYVAPGRYLTGTVVLKSHIVLELDVGATLLGSGNPDDYSVVDRDGQRRHVDTLIYAENAEDMTITGRGTIDGQGAIWWRRFQIDRIPAAQRTPAEQAQLLPTSALNQERPYLLSPFNCRELTIEHVTLRNSPFHTFQPTLCERVRVEDVTIFADKGSMNTDGINLQSCRNVQILNCRIDVGDDCIALNSGMNEAGRRRDRPSEDITIANCVTYRGHGGVVIGSATSGGVRDITVSNCVFHGTNIGIRIKSQRGRGGIVEGLSVSNVVMHDVPTPFTITTFYTGKDSPAEEYPVNEGTPQYRNFLFSNITARGADTAGNIVGLREMPIENITFSNVHIEAVSGFACTNARDITFLDSVIDVQKGPVLKLRNAVNIDTARLRGRTADESAPLVATLEPARNPSPPPAQTGSAKRATPAVPPPPAHATRKTFSDVGLVMIRVAPGTFLMGSPSVEPRRDPDEDPRTQVTLTQPFWLGQYEVTQHEWTAVMGTNPSRFKGETLPVEKVSWFDAVEFCRKLTERERAAGNLPEGARFTLPTEAQWEYACRAGTTGSYGGTGVLADMGWSKYDAKGSTHPVGQKRPNAWGFYDMHGNVCEWCLDWKGAYPGGAVTDPAGPAEGTLRVYRGGSWWPYEGGACRSAYRDWYQPILRTERLGFRVALVGLP